MKKIVIFVLFFICIGTKSKAQNYTELVDGNVVNTSNSYFADSLKSKESSATDYIGIYQKYISGIRGQECPMYPSCSNFGLKTFSETDFVSAFVLTSDRLLRCGHDFKNYSLSLRPNGFKYIDFPAYDAAPDELYYTSNRHAFAFSDTIKDDSTVLFVKNLINNEYYQEALLEIRRVEFYKSVTIELFINKLICLSALGEYEKALFEYETKCNVNYKHNTELLYYVALLNYKLKNYKLTLSVINRALESSSTSIVAPKLIALQGVANANLYDWQASIDSYNLLAQYTMYSAISQANLPILDNALHLKMKSPAMAGILSIIPGAGYAYAGHKQTAFSALLVNGLIAYAVYSSYKVENYGMVALTGVFNLSFYIGNIYGAITSTKRYNAQLKKNTVNKLEFNANL